MSDMSAPSYGMSSGSDSPVQVSIGYPENPSRILALFSLPFFLARYILLIPALIVLYVLGIVVWFVAWFGQWAVLFTGRYPQGFYTFISGFIRWQTRAFAYLMGVTDKYPPFSLSE